MKIILLGYMGCGKTYIGSLLSKMIKYPHIDLDSLIESILQLTIKQIFEIYGEKNFRLIEKIALNKFCKNYNRDKYIFSLGGGTPCFYNNINYVNRIGETFYLKTNYKILYKRLSKDYINRPLLKQYKGIELYKFIKNHLKYRNKYYYKSKHIINAGMMTFSNVAKYIKNNLKI